MYHAWVPKDWKNIILFNPNKLTVEDRVIIKEFDSIIDCLDFLEVNFNKYRGNLKWDRIANSNIVEQKDDIIKGNKSVEIAINKQLCFLE